jgi:hypothetical protein
MLIVGSITVLINEEIGDDGFIGDRRWLFTQAFAYGGHFAPMPFGHALAFAPYENYAATGS